MVSFLSSKAKEGHAVKSYKELVAWQKTMDLVVAVYEITETFPVRAQNWKLRLKLPI